jgi:Flp pilus assembly protein TadG
MRDGALAVEMAVVLPFLCIFAAATADFARAFYFYVTITNCALTGATYASSDPAHKTDSTAIQQYAQADATNLSPLPTVTSAPVTDSLGYACVNVTVSYSFRPLVGLLYPSSINLSRTVRMRVAPTAPD